MKESKRQFIFDVVNEGGEKEKMELFVNFCEDTIFEMQLAAQMSDTGERLAVKDESERERPEEESPEMGFFSVTTVRMALLALQYNVMLLIKVRACTRSGSGAEFFLIIVVASWIAVVLLSPILEYRGSFMTQVMLKL